jgi:CheY-like chemotaxis protein
MDPDEGRILLVEDNPSDVELILHAFAKAGIDRHVHVVYDGAEALAYLAGQPGVRIPDVVILDLKLPKVSGLQVLRHLRSIPATTDIPVVIFSSSSEERDVQETRQIGVDMYLVKPVNHEEFKRALGRIIAFWQSLPKDNDAETGP